MWSVWRWLSQLWLVFVLWEVDATLIIGCGIWEHFQSFRKVKCLQGYPKTLWTGKSPAITSWTVGSQSPVLPISEFSISGYNCGFQFRGIPVQILWVANSRFRLYKFVFRISEGIKYLDLSGGLRNLSFV